MKPVFYRHLEGRPVLLAVLFALVVASAVAVALSADSYRKQVNAMFEQTYRHDQLQAEWGRLVLEHSTWTAHNRIEAVAAERLDMLIPEPAAVRVVTP